ncbi:MAG: aminomethyl-transferring glycine dehydrogenase subunit GcvPB [Deltaproteobacteria bacterium]|nr:aminomethyl-transferring glycine dehydrogenase subunit GcvPB [Deltaproteobacteria bacterium]MBW1872092.1 aminomethyl-transferring glycine dehydrogenase subunit GcvPB [Deltaproteobacteria bacterium]
MHKSTSGRTSLVHDEPLIFERSVAGRSGHSLPETFGDPESALQHIPEYLLRKQPPILPEVDEPTVVRHFTRLSTWNHGIDSGMYPLGSCTMKYNPRINESLARLPGFCNLHPYLPIDLCQGALQLMWELADYLAEISGFDQVTLQPAAGAHGELTGIKMIRAYHKAKGNPRRRVLVPDTAHGTNPASSKLSGYDVIEIKSGPDGILMPAAVAQVMDQDIAAIMITNPNTLGLFESAISEISDIVHRAGGLVYCDGANLNSIMGITRPGDMGIDVLQFNLHKTFSTPHGGGGPGSGPVGVSAELAPYLPIPIIEKQADRFSLVESRPDSIGRIKGFYGNFAVMVRAYVYIRELGAPGLKKASEMAVLNANYIRARLEGTFDLPFPKRSMHEVVFSDKHLEELGVSTLDLAKCLLDHGFHPPTVYFPLVVHGALMIEPTETESLETLDEFVAAMLAIDQQARSDPQQVRSAPHHTVVGRLDEVKAAREPILKWTPANPEKK